MADNVVADAGAGGSTFATDDIAGVHYPRSKVVWGVDGVATDVSAADPLPVTAASLPLPAGASTLAEQQTQTTALQLLDDAVYASDGALNKTVGIGAVFDDAATVAITENQGGYLRMSSRRALLVEGVASGTAIPVSGTVAATQSGAWDVAITELPTAAAITDNFANPTTTSVMSMGMVWDGATWDRSLGNATDGALVNLGANNDVTITSGTITSLTQMNGAAISMNTGVRDAGTQRVTIATNDAVPVTFTGSTDAATQTTLASLLTSSQLIDDTIYASDAALNKTQGIGAVFDDVATVAITENQAGYLRMSSRRALLVEGVASGTAVSTNWAGTSPPIGAGTEAAALRVTLATDSTGLVSVDDNGASISVDWNGTQPVTGSGTATGALRVELPTNGTGVIATVGAVTSITNPLPANTNTQEVVGDAADAAAQAGNPVSMGLTARTTNRTAVTDGQAVRAAADDMGRALVVIGQPRDLIGQQHTQIASSAAETTIVTAVASTFCDLVQLVITNQTATAVTCTIKDSTAGTTRMIIALAASGGAVIPFPRPIPQTTVNNNWTCTLSSAAVTVNIFALFERNV